MDRKWHRYPSVRIENLPPDITESEVVQLCSSYGSVHQVRFIPVASQCSSYRNIHQVRFPPIVTRGMSPARSLACIGSFGRGNRHGIGRCSFSRGDVIRPVCFVDFCRQEDALMCENCLIGVSLRNYRLHVRAVRGIPLAAEDQEGHSTLRDSKPRRGSSQCPKGGTRSKKGLRGSRRNVNMGRGAVDHVSPGKAGEGRVGTVSHELETVVGGGEMIPVTPVQEFAVDGSLGGHNLHASLGDGNQNLENVVIEKLKPGMNSYLDVGESVGTTGTPYCRAQAGEFPVVEKYRDLVPNTERPGEPVPWEFMPEECVSEDLVLRHPVPVQPIPKMQVYVRPMLKSSVSEEGKPRESRPAEVNFRMPVFGTSGTVESVHKGLRCESMLTKPVPRNLSPEKHRSGEEFVEDINTVVRVDHIRVVQEKQGTQVEEVPPHLNGVSLLYSAHGNGALGDMDCTDVTVPPDMCLTKEAAFEVKAKESADRFMREARIVDKVCETEVAHTFLIPEPAVPGVTNVGLQDESVVDGAAAVKAEYGLTFFDYEDTLVDLFSTCSVREDPSENFTEEADVSSKQSSCHLANTEACHVEDSEGKFNMSSSFNTSQLPLAIPPSSPHSFSSSASSSSTSPRPSTSTVNRGGISQLGSNPQEGLSQQTTAESPGTENREVGKVAKKKHKKASDIKRGGSNASASSASTSTSEDGWKCPDPHCSAKNAADLLYCVNCKFPKKLNESSTQSFSSAKGRRQSTGPQIRRYTTKGWFAHAISPIKFCGWTAVQKADKVILGHLLCNFMDRRRQAPQQVALNEIYGLEVEGTWERVQVISHQEKKSKEEEQEEEEEEEVEKFLVALVDNGRSVEVRKEDLALLPRSTKDITPLLTEFTLKHLKPMHKADQDLQLQGQQWLTERLAGQELELHCIENSDYKDIIIQLNVGGCSINQEAVEKGFAQIHSASTKKNEDGANKVDALRSEHPSEDHDVQTCPLSPESMVKDLYMSFKEPTPPGRYLHPLSKEEGNPDDVDSTEIDDIFVGDKSPSSGYEQQQQQSSPDRCLLDGEISGGIDPVVNREPSALYVQPSTEHRQVYGKCNSASVPQKEVLENNILQMGEEMPPSSDLGLPVKDAKESSVEVPSQSCISPSQSCISRFQPCATPSPPYISSQPYVSPSQPYVSPSQPCMSTYQLYVSPVPSCLSPSQPVQSPSQLYMPPSQPYVSPQPCMPLSQPHMSPTQPCVPSSQFYIPPSLLCAPQPQPSMSQSQSKQCSPPPQHPLQSFQPPVQPFQPPAHPFQPPVQPFQLPVHPSQQPVELSQQPVEPSQQPVEPSRPTGQLFQPVQPSQQPIEPSQQPVVPSQQPTQPSLQPALMAQPPIQLLQPSVQLSQQSTSPSEPSVQPSQPLTSPQISKTQPSQLCTTSSSSKSLSKAKGNVSFFRCGFKGKRGTGKHSVHPQRSHNLFKEPVFGWHKAASMTEAPVSRASSYDWLSSEAYRAAQEAGLEFSMSQIPSPGELRFYQQNPLPQLDALEDRYRRSSLMDTQNQDLHSNPMDDRDVLVQHLLGSIAAFREEIKRLDVQGASNKMHHVFQDVETAMKGRLKVSEQLRQFNPVQCALDVCLRSQEPLALTEYKHLQLLPTDGQSQQKPQDVTNCRRLKARASQFVDSASLILQENDGLVRICRFVAEVLQYGPEERRLAVENHLKEVTKGPPTSDPGGKEQFLKEVETLEKWKVTYAQAKTAVETSVRKLSSVFSDFGTAVLGLLEGREAPPYPMPDSQVDQLAQDLEIENQLAGEQEALLEHVRVAVMQELKEQVEIHRQLEDACASLRETCQNYLKVGSISVSNYGLTDLEEHWLLGDTTSSGSSCKVEDEPSLYEFIQQGHKLPQTLKKFFIGQIIQDLKWAHDSGTVVGNLHPRHIQIRGGAPRLAANSSGPVEHLKDKQFQAPEFSSGEYCQSGDVYSLGKLVWWLLDPGSFDAQDETKGNDDVLLAMLNSDPNLRPTLAEIQGHVWFSEDDQSSNGMIEDPGKTPQFVSRSVWEESQKISKNKQKCIEEAILNELLDSDDSVSIRDNSIEENDLKEVDSLLSSGKENTPKMRNLEKEEAVFASERRHAREVTKSGMSAELLTGQGADLDDQEYDNDNSPQTGTTSPKAKEIGLEDVPAPQELYLDVDSSQTDDEVQCLHLKDHRLHEDLTTSTLEEFIIEELEDSEMEPSCDSSTDGNMPSELDILCTDPTAFEHVPVYLGVNEGEGTDIMEGGDDSSQVLAKGYETHDEEHDKGLWVDELKVEAHDFTRQMNEMRIVKPAVENCGELYSRELEPDEDGDELLASSVDSLTEADSHLARARELTPVSADCFSGLGRGIPVDISREASILAELQDTEEEEEEGEERLWRKETPVCDKSGGSARLDLHPSDDGATVEPQMIDNEVNEDEIILILEDPERPLDL